MNDRTGFDGVWLRRVLEPGQDFVLPVRLFRFRSLVDPCGDRGGNV
jgi:hypothetical protein